MIRRMRFYANPTNRVRTLLLLVIGSFDVHERYILVAVVGLRIALAVQGERLLRTGMDTGQTVFAGALELGHAAHREVLTIS